MPTGGGGTSGKDEGMKDLKPMLLTNNQRKMHGLPMWRKKNRKKRFYTRCEADEENLQFDHHGVQRNKLRQRSGGDWD